MKRDTQASYKYIIRDKKKTAKLAKITYKKKDNDEDDGENIGRDAQENRKVRSNRVIELSRPPIASIKNIKRGVSVEYDKVVLAQKNFTMLL